MSELRSRLERLEGQVIANRLMIALILKEISIADPDLAAYIQTRLNSMIDPKHGPLPENIFEGEQALGRSEALVRSVRDVIGKAFS